MAQYKHDRFFKFYVRSLYQSKGETLQNIQVRNDEDLEIDLMFISQSDKFGWQEENLGLFDRLMQVHNTIIVEHFSGYLEEKHIHKSLTRKNLYWEPKEEELVETAKKAQNLTSYQRLSPEFLQSIEQHNPFTWILAVNCSQNLLNFCGANPHSEFDRGVYLLTGFLRMGLVVIEQLEYSPDTIWLKLLGNKQSAQRAFSEIKQLAPERREKNDTIRASLKYCVYLKELPTDSLTNEEQELMRTMAEIDAWYEAEINKAKNEGELQGQLKYARKMISAKFEGYVLTAEVSSKLESLTEQQLDEFTVRIFNWQQPATMEEWLTRIVGS
jgi:hypothetical protein